MVNALVLFTLVFYNAPDYEVIVYEYPVEEFEIEVTCAEGVTDCKDIESVKPIQETVIYRPYGSYFPTFPYY